MPIASLALCVCALAQAPPLTLTLQDALQRARQVSQQALSAAIQAQIAHEDTVQSRAALLPSVTSLNQLTYTQPNGTDTGVFIAANAPHEYLHQAIVRGDIFAPAKRADYHRAMAAEAVARARAEIALRGLVVTVVQDYYTLASASRKLANARRALGEAQQFVDITTKQEAGGEVAHSDVVKAQIVLEQRQRDVQDAEIAVDKARIGFGVILFTDYRQDFTVVDDLDTATPLPALTEVRALAQRNNPDLRAAQAAVTQERFGRLSARSALYPTLSFGYLFGMDSNQYALRNSLDRANVGSGAQLELNIPIWTWGAARSRMRQADLRVQQAQVELTVAQRQLLANLDTFYLEARTAGAQLDSLRRSLQLSEESLRLTILRYQAGEVSVLEVVDAQSTLAQARNAYDDGLVRYRLALGGLQTLTGVF